MSRTKKGSKGPEYEYWSARPGNRHGAPPGKTSKRLTHRAERRDGKGQSGTVKACYEQDDGPLTEECLKGLESEARRALPKGSIVRRRSLLQSG